MDKGDKVKKSLVRNTQIPINRPTKINCNQNKQKFGTKSTNKLPENVSRTGEIKTTDFHLPELNTILKLKEKINTIENLNIDKIKSNTKLTLDEEISNKVNFPYDQAIYKDLIPLKVKTDCKQSQPSRGPYPNKDKEPNLNDYLEINETPEYIYEPTIFKNETQTKLITVNNLRLYKVLELLK